MLGFLSWKACLLDWIFLCQGDGMPEPAPLTDRSTWEVCSYFRASKPSPQAFYLAAADQHPMRNGQAGDSDRWTHSCSPASLWWSPSVILTGWYTAFCGSSCKAQHPIPTALPALWPRDPELVGASRAGLATSLPPRVLLRPRESPGNMGRVVKVPQGCPSWLEALLPYLDISRASPNVVFH